jgi:hypothetical protein
MLAFADKLAGLSGICLAACLVSACDDGNNEAVFWKNERQITELAHQAGLAQYRLHFLQTEGVAQLEKAKTTLSDLEARIVYLKSEHSNLISSVGNLELRNQAFVVKDRNARREQALGMGFAVFQTRNGRVYTNVRVSEVDDSGVKIRHDHGAAGLRYADLTDDQRRIFGLEEQSALAAEKRERWDVLAYEKNMALQLEAIRKSTRAADKAAGERAARASSSRRAALATLASHRDTESSPLAQAARPLGSGSSYRSYSSRSPSYRYVYYHPAPSVSRSVGSRSSCNTPFQYVSPRRTPAPACPPPASQYSTSILTVP